MYPEILCIKFPRHLCCQERGQQLLVEQLFRARIAGLHEEAAMSMAQFDDYGAHLF